VNLSEISSETRLGRLLRLPFKLLPSGAVVRILRGPARGKRWISDSTTRGFWLGYWELKNQRLFAAALHPGDVVYDIGAHVGLYTLVSSIAVGENGHVFAFEPLPRNAFFLRRHISLNRIKNCTVVEAAVSNINGSRQFEPTSHDTAGHFSQSGAATVHTIELDEFFRSAQGRRPNAMKINAEGAELEVLQGAKQLLHDSSPLIFLSLHSEEMAQACNDLLTSMGYSVKFLAADKIWAVNPNKHGSRAYDGS